MIMKIEVSIDMEDFIERWGEDSLATIILDDIKAEALRIVKDTAPYKAMLEGQIGSMLDNLTEENFQRQYKDPQAAFNKILNAASDYLENHEADIADSINDFRDLHELFVMIFGREPGNVG